MDLEDREDHRDFNDCAPIPSQDVPTPPSGALNPAGSATVQSQQCGKYVHSDHVED